MELYNILLSGCSEEEIHQRFDGLNSEAYATTLLTILQFATKYEIELEKLDLQRKLKELNYKKDFPETITICYPGFDEE